MAREIKVNIVGDSKGYSKALNSATKASSSFGKSLAKVGKIAAIGLGAGLVVAAVGLKKSVDAAQEAQVSLLKLQAQMKASGLSYEKFGKQIEDTIDAQSRLAAVDDEELQDSFTNILRVVPNVSEALRLNALAADISRAKGIDLAKAGELVGKVAGGNLGILSRYGIVLEEGATKQEALAVLQEKFGGQAEAYGSSVAGAGDRVRVAMENIAETIGTMVFPLAERVLGAFTEALEGVQDFADRIAAASGFKAKFSVAFTGIKGAAQDVWDEFADLITGTSQAKPLKLKSGKIIEWEAPAAGLAKQIQDGIKSTDWGAIGKTIGANITSKVKITAEFLGSMLDAANSWIDSHTGEIGEIGAKILLKIATALTDPIFWAKNWDIVLLLIVSKFPGGAVLGKLGVRMAGFLARPFVKFFGKQIERLPRLIGGALRLGIAAIGKFVVDSKNRFVAWATGLRGTIKAAFRLTAVLFFYNTLKNIFNKIKDAVTNMANWIRNKVRQIPAFLQPVRAAFFTVLGPIQLIIAAVQRLIDWIGRIPSPGSIGQSAYDQTLGRIPGLASGGTITRSGMAVVHRGENVVPARAVRTGNGSGSSGPGQFALVWAGPDFIRWMREQDRRSRLGGSLA